MFIGIMKLLHMRLSLCSLFIVCSILNLKSNDSTFRINFEIGGAGFIYCINLDKIMLPKSQFGLRIGAGIYPAPYVNVFYGNEPYYNLEPQGEDVWLMTYVIPIQVYKRWNRWEANIGYTYIFYYQDFPRRNPNPTSPYNLFIISKNEFQNLNSLHVGISYYIIDKTKFSFSIGANIQSIADGKLMEKDPVVIPYPKINLSYKL